MERLLTILSGTLVFANCSGMQVGNIKNIYGYYNQGTYNVNYCVNKNTNMESVIYHELGHLYRFMYLNKIGTLKQQEDYANYFATCWLKHPRCRTQLKKQISKKVIF